MAESVSSKNQDRESGSVDINKPLMVAAHEYTASSMESANELHQEHEEQQDQEQQQQLQHPPLHSHNSRYHHFPPPPPHIPYATTGPYSAAVGNQSRSGPYPPPLHPHSQGFQAPNGPISHMPPPSHHDYLRPIPLRAHEGEYLGHHPPPSSSYSAPIPMYGSPPDDRRWMGPEGQAPHMFSGYEVPHYGKPLSSQSFPPPPPSHIPYGYPHPVYPPTSNNRLEDNPRLGNHEPAPASSEVATSDVEQRDHRATSPSQISSAHRDEVSNMGCTCKKTKCLKLYCQCFAVKICCGTNCRCLVCFNTTKHEKQRKDARRIILSRNPAAFDTKFSKTKERKTTEQQPILAHKLGCKCRKSACMKKYCECYAGNVKCSANCRCLGCKNAPLSDFGQEKTKNAGVLLPSYEAPASHGQRLGGREPWMMNAAQNLTFLKHGSPTGEKLVAAVNDSGDVVSMPSLAASSSDTSPEERHDEATNEGCLIPADEEANSNVNSLLLAAMAMTEFQSRNTSTGNFDQSQELPVNGQVAVEQCQLPNPKFPRASPKRKSSDLPNHRHVTGVEVAHLRNPVIGKPLDGKASSPLDPREMKRTRLGCAWKKVWVKEEDIGKGTPDDVGVGDQASARQTPDPKTRSIDKLTPISARCIDFTRMHVDEKKDLGLP